MSLRAAGCRQTRRWYLEFGILVLILFAFIRVNSRLIFFLPVRKFLSPRPVIRHYLAASAQLVFIRQQTLDADRASGVKLAGADANLRAQSVAEAVREARGCIVKNAGRVHFIEEAGSGLRIFGQDALGVP